MREAEVVAARPGALAMLAAGVALAVARAVEPYLPGAQGYLSSLGVVPVWESWAAAVTTMVAALGLGVLSAPPAQVRNALLVLGWVSCVLLLWSAVGIVFDLFRAFFWITGIPAGDFALVDWPGFLTRAVAFVALIIAAGTTLVHQRVWRDRCWRCGRGATPPESARYHWLGYAACGLAFVYPTVKYYWWLGGRLGRPPIYTEGFPAMETALLIGGVVLSLALVRPWGRIVPPWLPLLGGRTIPRLIPIVAGFGLSVMLILQGTMTIFGVLGRLLAGQSLPIDGSTNSWIILTVYASWALFGVALLGATRGYQLRSRSVCPACHGPAATSRPAAGRAESAAAPRSLRRAGASTNRRRSR